MTRLIDNMERQHLVVRISDKKDRRTNLIHLTKDGKELEERPRHTAAFPLNPLRPPPLKTERNWKSAPAS